MPEAWSPPLPIMRDGMLGLVRFESRVRAKDMVDGIFMVGVIVIATG